MKGHGSEVICLRLFRNSRHPSACCSLVRQQSESWKRDLKPRQCRPSPSLATVTVLAFAQLSGALPRAARCLPGCEASSKRQGDGQRFQKKAMKITYQIKEASAPANVRPTSVSKTKQTAFVKHCTNRGLSTEAVLNCLRTLLPRHYELAEVVGK